MSETLPPEMPGFRFVGVPQRFRSHPLLSTAPYFTLPVPLLRQVVEEVGADRFDPDLLEMEDALSEVCQDHDSQIGFWGGQPITFLLLRPNNDLTSDSLVQGMAEMLGRSEDEMRSTLAQAGERLDWSTNVRRGYCGWLMTNRTFLDEHRQILEEWKEEVARNGIPTMGPVARDAQAVPGAQRAEGDTK